MVVGVRPSVLGCDCAGIEGPLGGLPDTENYSSYDRCYQECEK